MEVVLNLIKMVHCKNIFFALILFLPKANAQFLWQSLDAPNSSGTFIDGIEGNNLVGSFNDSSTPANATKGFLYDGSTWTVLEAPGAIYTRALKISGDRIVGFFQDSGFVDHGFICQNGIWTTLNHPESQGLGTQIRAISGSSIIGTFNNSQGGSTPFIYDGNSWTTLLSAPNTYTVPNGISGSVIVGYDYGNWPNGNLNGFVKTETGWTLLNFPGSGDTALHDIDGNNIVGDYTNTAGYWLSLGLLYNGTEWTTLQMPDSIHTGARGIDGNKIVGEYADSNNVYRGFILTVPEPSAISLLVFGGVVVALGRRKK